jgi:hypothetical protein
MKLKYPACGRRIARAAALKKGFREGAQILKKKGRTGFLAKRLAKRKARQEC